MTAADTRAFEGERDRGSSSLLAAPGETERRSYLRWLARISLVVWGLPKSILFNFRYLPPRQAIRLPVLVSHRMAIFNFGGRVTVRGPARTGSVLLGFGANGAFDFRRSRSVWQVAGEVRFDGPARLGNGFKLSVAESGRVTFGPGFVLSAESQIVCRESISFGRDCLISWDVLLLDSDFHPLIGAERRRGAHPGPDLARGPRLDRRPLRGAQGGVAWQRRRRRGRVGGGALARREQRADRRQPGAADPHGRALAALSAPI